MVPDYDKPGTKIATTFLEDNFETRKINPKPYDICGTWAIPARDPGERKNELLVQIGQCKL